MTQPKRKRNVKAPVELALVRDRPVFVPPGPLQTRTATQRAYLNSLKVNKLSISNGCAGTGKTYVALSYLLDLLVQHKVDRLIIVRPLVETGRSIGDMPGDLSLKLAPWVLPMLDIIEDRIGKSFSEYLFKTDKIRVTPLEFMRGSTFNNTAVLLTEAQNTTVVQMKMFLSRIGEDAKVCCEGDINQSDLKEPNGLEDALHRLQGLKDVGMIAFSKQDIVRSGLCQQIIERYE